MSEQLQRCPTCPERSCASKVLAKLSRVAMPADCTGPTIVHRGEVTTQTRSAGEPAPPQNTWNSVTSSVYGGGARYNRTDWRDETVCGRSTIEPQEGEEPYPIAEGNSTWIDEGGRRHVASIHGSKQGQSDVLAILAITRMLDSVEENLPVIA